MFNMANDGAFKISFLLLTLFYFVKNVNCSLSSTEARTLNSKYELMRIGFENQVKSAFKMLKLEIENVQDSVQTCKCNEQRKTNAGVDQPDQFKSNEVERINNKTLQTCIDRLANSFNDEKRARKVFEKEMVDLVRDLTKSPVHGGWADWDQWGECSQSCGTGLMQRSRQCSNPYPGPYGNHCFGDFTDTKQCVIEDCTQVHGGWADWAQWNKCSQTCGTGLAKRSRQCSNPYPGPDGSPCFGDSMDIKICVLRECAQADTTDGGWSGWTAWTGCTATCNGGLMTRDRHCNNPRPSSQGRYCDGPNRETQLCNTKSCPDPIVFFSVNNPRDSMVDDVVVFLYRVEYSSYNDYSTSTGKFTCQIPGLYHFFITFTSHENSGSDGNVYCRIRKNNVNTIHAYNSAFGYYKAYKEYTRNWRSASASVYLRLVKGDKVWVGGCYNWDNIGKDDAFLFVGALITAS